MINRGRPKKLEEKPSPGSPSPQMSCELTWDRARDSEVRSQQVIEIYMMVANLNLLCSKRGARGSVVVKALCCKPEGRGFKS
jgi:hypothetical protein